jgi:transposase-like protein
MKSDRIIEINEEKIKNHLGEFVRGTVEETLNAMLDAEADAIRDAQKCEHTPERKDTRTGSYGRKLQTKAGELNLQVQKMQTFFSIPQLSVPE